MTTFSASVLAQARLEEAKYTTGTAGNRATHKPGPHESGVRGVRASRSEETAPVLAPLSYFAHLHGTLPHSLITPPPLPASLSLTPSLPPLCCSPHLPSLLFLVPHFPFSPSRLLPYLHSPPFLTPLILSSRPSLLIPQTPSPLHPLLTPLPFLPSDLTLLHLDTHSEYRKKTGSGDGAVPLGLSAALLCSLGTDALQASVSSSIQFARPHGCPNSVSEKTAKRER